MKIIFIGDPHFKVKNVDVIDVFIEQCVLKVEEYKPDLCIIGGDLLDTHERLHQTPYNKAIKFIDLLRKKSRVVVLVGNHDYENNQQFLTDKHWMNPLKKWDKVTIVDNVVTIDNLCFVPYVPPGRFLEALQNVNLTKIKCVFAHQEFRGCNLGVLTSENGDKWPLDYPLVISGHIHKPHRPQKNIIYPGSIVQHSFGEANSKDNGILFVDFEKDIFEKIKIEIPQRFTVNVLCENFKDISQYKLKPLQKMRVICIGTKQEIKLIKKGSTFKKLPLGVSVVFRENTIIEDTEIKCVKNFMVYFEQNLNQETKKIFSCITQEKNFNEIYNELFKE